LVGSYPKKIDAGLFLIVHVNITGVHGIYPEPMILAMNYGMIITGWSAKNDSLRIFT
jgi:hypothetical protein